MSNEALYYSALQRLSTTTDGSYIFEKISLIIANYLYANDGYNFQKSEGGHGTQDGGYDGIDPIKKAKLACSLNEKLETKIKQEVEKSEKNNDAEIFYFTNQVVSQVDKNPVVKEYGKIKVIIHGISCLSKTLDEYFNEELYDLLELSFLINGARFNRGDAIKQNIKYNGKIYLKQIILETDIFNSPEPNENPLFDYITENLQQSTWDNIKHIFLKSIGGNGKSFLMGLTYNTLLDELLLQKENNKKYKTMPFIQFEQLKYYSNGCIENDIKNNIDPLLFFLDGLDEISEFSRIELSKELQRIINKNIRVRFVISGRSPAFINEIQSCFTMVEHLRLEKYADYSDIDLLRLLDKYKDTSIVTLLPIPFYRNYLLDNQDKQFQSKSDIDNTLIYDRFFEDKERYDYAKDKSKRFSSYDNEAYIKKIIKKMSLFCFELFKADKNTFTENELHNFIINDDDDDFIFVLHSSIIQQNDTTLSFISYFYYEYFVSKYIIEKPVKEIERLLFINRKIKISSVSIFSTVLNLLQDYFPAKHKHIKRKAINHSIETILLCDFASLSEKERFENYISIFNKYNKENKHIYYGRFNQPYNVLANINNMAQRMQELLPESKLDNALSILQTNINNYLMNPQKEENITFVNCVILLTPFSNILWNEKQQEILHAIAVKLIRFFLTNKQAEEPEIKNLLSYQIIINWFQDFKWTKNWNSEEDWYLFLKEIDNSFNKPCEKILNRKEFIIKLYIFISFYKNEALLAMYYPIVYYAINNLAPQPIAPASIVPERITDEYETPMIQFDYDYTALKEVITLLPMRIKDVLELLNIAIAKDLFNISLLSTENILQAVEDKLFKNINLITEDDYESFYTFLVLGDDPRIFMRFLENKKNNLCVLKSWIVKKVCSSEQKHNRWIIENILSNCININNLKSAYELFQLIESTQDKGIYSGVVYLIHSNENHILHNCTEIEKKYQSLFKDRIKAEEKIQKKKLQINIQIEFMKNKEVELLLSNDLMVTEIKNITTYLKENKDFDPEEKSKIRRLRSLWVQIITSEIEYSDKNEHIVPPIFSQTAISIIDAYYQNNIFDVEKIIKSLNLNYFLPEYFYFYFYQFYITGRDTEKMTKDDIIFFLNNNQEIKEKIILSMQVHVKQQLDSKDAWCFSNYNQKLWIIPFLYYFDSIFNKEMPAWLDKNNIIKLIVFPYKIFSSTMIINHDMTMEWFEMLFEEYISKNEIIDFGLKIIDQVILDASRSQLIDYFVTNYNIVIDLILKTKIKILLIKLTKEMFQNIELDISHAEYDAISRFWTQCTENYFDEIFEMLSVDMINSTSKHGKSVDCQHRKKVLDYCLRITSIEQKEKIISDLKKELRTIYITKEVRAQTISFLASLGDEKAIQEVITSFLNGAPVNNRFYSPDTLFGFMKKSTKLLINFTKLYIYSTSEETERMSDRRQVLFSIAKKGIQQHITQMNFLLMKWQLYWHIRKLQYKNQYTDYISDFILRMEQSVFEITTNKENRGITQ
jgi:hypothetical protein